ncbi:hypothetical protein BST83_16835 [Polaribacter filamentus]|uniref:Uncharacterized protein n=1 Tax=Polaribacter filamentus TaxID=53483 RepID=A0A2S7KK66_9FLAO|nr:hypothetical protein [Polaribacter filamentus]PQB03004.1 hypothetical protein BST83_16835 [Polaribacter filamentus]
MNIKQVKNELQDILSEKISYSIDLPIQTIISFLRTSKKTSTLLVERQQNKAEEIRYFIDTSFYNKPSIFWNAQNE